MLEGPLTHTEEQAVSMVLQKTRHRLCSMWYSSNFKSYLKSLLEHFKGFDADQAHEEREKFYTKRGDRQTEQQLNKNDLEKLHFYGRFRSFDQCWNEALEGCSPVNMALAGFRRDKYWDNFSSSGMVCIP